MENDYFADTGIVKNRVHRYILSFAWIAFLYVSMVGLKPFAPRIGIDIRVDTSEVDWTLQFTQVALASIIILVTYLRNSYCLQKLPNIAHWHILIVLTWCGITLFWSPVPLIGFRRLALTSLFIFAVFSVVQGLGAWHALHLFALCIAILVVVSVVAGPVIPNAIHHTGERDINIIGAWRGIFYHKNHSGLVAALCVISSFFMWRMRQGHSWLIAFTAGIILLILSRSKTSIILCFPALISGLYLGKLKTAGRELFILFMIFTTIGFVSFFSILLFTMGDKITIVLNDPTAFTGRMTIWKALWEVILNNPFSGVGFGSLYHTGIHTANINSAIALISQNNHGHNGYLDIMASTGVTGCLLALFAFVIKPYLMITNSEFKSPWTMAPLLYGILIFLILHEMLETSMLDRGRPAWVALLLVCAISHAFSRRSKKESNVETN